MCSFIKLCLYEAPQALVHRFIFKSLLIWVHEPPHSLQSWANRSSTDGRMHGQTDGGTNGRTDGQTDERTDKRMDERTDDRTDGRTNGQTNDRTNDRTDGRTDKRTDGRTDNGFKVICYEGSKYVSICLNSVSRIIMNKGIPLIWRIFKK